MEGDYVGMAWRALSLLQKDCEAKGAPIAPAARNAEFVLRDLIEVGSPIGFAGPAYDAHPLNLPAVETGD